MLPARKTTLQQSISDTSMSSTGILITSPSIFQATGLVVYVSQNGVNWVSRQWSDVNAAGEKINLIPSRNIIQGIGGILSVGNVTNDIKITGNRA